MQRAGSSAARISKLAIPRGKTHWCHSLASRNGEAGGPPASFQLPGLPKQGEGIVSASACPSGHANNTDLPRAADPLTEER